MLWFLAVLLVFHDTIHYYTTVWQESSTFSHGFFVLPLALYFAWLQRGKYLTVAPAPSVLAACFAVTIVLVEFVGHVLGISTIQQVAVIGVAIFCIVAFAGWQVSLRMWFPLSLLLFIPPLGNELMPLFQSVTADLSVWMLGITPIPVHHDGLYITIPGQVFEVAEACSGIRFFVTCVFLGYIYAAINFVSMRKRLLFLAFALVLPIFANGLRVFGIIMLGHYVDMRFAKGFDHLFVGWVFFFLMTGILLLVGIMFADKTPVPAQAGLHPGWAGHDWRKPFMLAMLPLALSVALKMSLNPDMQYGEVHVVRAQPANQAGWAGDSDWQPHLQNPAGTLRFPVQSNGRSFDIFIGWYNDDKPGRELLTGANRLYDSNRWSTKEETTRQIKVADNLLARIMVIVSPAGKQRFILYWYEVPGAQTANKITIKLYQGINKVSHRFRGGKILAVSGNMRPGDTTDSIVAMLQQNGIFGVMDQATEIRQ